MPKPADPLVGAPLIGDGAGTPLVGAVRKAAGARVGRGGPEVGAGAAYGAGPGGAETGCTGRTWIGVMPGGGGGTGAETAGKGCTGVDENGVNDTEVSLAYAGSVA